MIGYVCLGTNDVARATKPYDGNKLNFCCMT